MQTVNTQICTGIGSSKEFSVNRVFRIAGVKRPLSLARLLSDAALEGGILCMHVRTQSFVDRV
jgi:hypothetical protein